MCVWTCKQICSRAIRDPLKTPCIVRCWLRVAAAAAVITAAAAAAAAAAACLRTGTYSTTSTHSTRVVSWYIVVVSLWYGTGTACNVGPAGGRGVAEFGRRLPVHRRLGSGVCRPALRNQQHGERNQCSESARSGCVETSPRCGVRRRRSSTSRVRACVRACERCARARRMVCAALTTSQIQQHRWRVHVCPPD